jgi:hypothetical protein
VVQVVQPSAGLLTRDELKRQERESIAAALKQAGGRVFGANGGRTTGHEAHDARLAHQGIGDSEAA